MVCEYPFVWRLDVVLGLIWNLVCVARIVSRRSASYCGIMCRGSNAYRRASRRGVNSNMSHMSSRRSRVVQCEELLLKIRSSPRSRTRDIFLVYHLISSNLVSETNKSCHGGVLILCLVLETRTQKSLRCCSYNALLETNNLILAPLFCSFYY